jgi:hypothetical protein
LTDKKIIHLHEKKYSRIKTKYPDKEIKFGMRRWFGLTKKYSD